ncbi:hypothetical protein D3C79_958290 [compost metagenome]
MESAARVCRAIRALNEAGGKLSHTAIAKLAGVPPGSMNNLLEKMKTKNGLPSHPNQTLVTLRGERMTLTKHGKVAADMAVVDRDMTKRIEALKKAGGDDDTDTDEE